MSDEQWKQIKYEGVSYGYSVSNHGRVRNDKTNKLLEGGYTNNYYVVKVGNPNGGQKSFTVSRLVATAFLDNYDDLPYVNHIDGNTHNNHVSNLEWITQKDNIQHALQNNLIDFAVQPVKQYDSEGVFLTEYPSIRDAARELLSFEQDRDLTTEEYDLLLKQKANAIGKVVNGDNKTSHGFIWKFSNEKDEKNEKDINNIQHKVIEDHPNYAITVEGEVYSFTTKKFLKPLVNKNNQHYVSLMANKKKKNRYINILVAEAFLPKKKDDNVVRHKNKDKSDNRVENLEWKSIQL